MELKRSYLIDLSEVLYSLENKFETVLGPQSLFLDYKELIMIFLDHYFFNRSLNKIETFFLYHKVPTDVLNFIKNDISLQTFTLIQKCFIIIYPSRIYSYQFIDSNTILIEESLNKQNDNLDCRIDESDFIPEKMRLK